MPICRQHQREMLHDSLWYCPEPACPVQLTDEGYVRTVPLFGSGACEVG